MPRPEKHVFVCVQTRPAGHPRGSCGQSGSGDLLQALGQGLAQAGLAERVALTSCGCLGPCGDGPNVLVYPQGVLYLGVSRDDVPSILDHLAGGEPVTRLLAPATVWS
jgi:(2Fe-2S) ferredoxin